MKKFMYVLIYGYDREGDRVAGIFDDLETAEIALGMIQKEGRGDSQRIDKIAVNELLDF